MEQPISAALRLDRSPQSGLYLLPTGLSFEDDRWELSRIFIPMIFQERDKKQVEEERGGGREAIHRCLENIIQERVNTR